MFTLRAISFPQGLSSFASLLQHLNISVTLHLHWNLAFVVFLKLYFFLFTCISVGLHVCTGVISVSFPQSQKWVFNIPELELQVVVGLDSDPLEEQPVFLVAEPSLQIPTYLPKDNYSSKAEYAGSLPGPESMILLSFHELNSYLSCFLWKKYILRSFLLEKIGLSRC